MALGLILMEEWRQALGIIWDQERTENAFSLSPANLSAYSFFPSFCNHDFGAVSTYQIFYLFFTLHKENI